MKSDGKVRERKEELVEDAGLIIDKIKKLGKGNKCRDPLISPAVISRAINKGVLDAPHLFGVKAAKGTIRTMFIEGKNLAVDEHYKPISEKYRLSKIKDNH